MPPPEAEPEPMGTAAKRNVLGSGPAEICAECGKPVGNRNPLIGECGCWMAGCPVSQTQPVVPAATTSVPKAEIPVVPVASVSEPGVLEPEPDGKLLKPDALLILNNDFLKPFPHETETMAAEEIIDLSNDDLVDDGQGLPGVFFI